MHSVTSSTKLFGLKCYPGVYFSTSTNIDLILIAHFYEEYYAEIRKTFLKGFRYNQLSTNSKTNANILLISSEHPHETS